jgi:pyruvate/2-oxoglutarate/acetoin dehydrogenase E1 component
LRVWYGRSHFLGFRFKQAIIVEEAWRSVISAEVSARIMEKVFYDLDAHNDYVVRKSRSPMPIIWRKRLFLR